MIDSSLYTYLSGIQSFPVQEGKIDADRLPPWVWFRRSSTNQELGLDGSQQNGFETTFDVEVVGPDIDLVQTMADTIKTNLHGFHGWVFSTWATAVFANDHSDDYIVRSVLDTDSGYHVAAFQLQIFHQA